MLTWYWASFRDWPHWPFAKAHTSAGSPMLNTIPMALCVSAPSPCYLCPFTCGLQGVTRARRRMTASTCFAVSFWSMGCIVHKGRAQEATLYWFRPLVCLPQYFLCWLDSGSLGFQTGTSPTLLSYFRDWTWDLMYARQALQLSYGFFLESKQLDRVRSLGRWQHVGTSKIRSSTVNWYLSFEFIMACVSTHRLYVIQDQGTPDHFCVVWHTFIVCICQGNFSKYTSKYYYQTLLWISDFIEL